MMKKLGVILLALCMFSVSVFADEQTFNPTVDVQRSEVQMDSAYRAFLLTRPDEQCNNDCMSVKERTQITANLEVIGDVSEYGDTFIARASVTNVGAKPAYYVVGYFTADGIFILPDGMRQIGELEELFSISWDLPFLPVFYSRNKLLDE